MISDLSRHAEKLVESPLPAVHQFVRIVEIVIIDHILVEGQAGGAVVCKQAEISGDKIKLFVYRQGRFRILIPPFAVKRHGRGIQVIEKLLGG